MTSFALQNVFQNLKFKETMLDEKVFGKKLGMVSRLLGCQHRRLTRPFGSGGRGVNDQPRKTEFFTFLFSSFVVKNS